LIDFAVFNPTPLIGCFISRILCKVIMLTDKDVSMTSFYVDQIGQITFGERGKNSFENGTIDH
jgi:hypothetical protein